MAVDTTCQRDIARACASGSEHAERIRDVLARVGDKWSLLVIGMLTSGPLRFGHLADRVPGISQRMLAETLKRLDRDGLVTRTSYPEIPPRVEYALTDLGRSLLEPALALATWAYEHGNEIEANREAFDLRASR